MAISYPSLILGGGGLSTVFTSGSVTGSGEETNPVRLKENIVVTSLTASVLTASQLILDSDPYAKLTGGNSFDSTNTFNYLEAQNTVTINGSNNSDYAYLHLQGSTESRLRIRKGLTEVGSIHNSNNDLVIEASNKLQISGSTAVSGNVQLIGAIINGNLKTNVSTASPTIVDFTSKNTKCAKYVILVETTTGIYHVQSQDLLLANNGSTVLITPYALTTTNGTNLAVFDAQINGDYIELLVTKLTSEEIAVSMTKTYLS
jgi:hypothetical protein